MNTPSAGAHLILGATGAIGSSVARLLADRDAPLVLGARHPDRLAELGDALGAVTIPVSAEDPESITQAVARAESEFGRLEGLVNCMGSLLLKPAHLTSDEDWEDTMAVNLTSSFYAVRAGVKAMTASGGSIVLVSSAAARIGLANHEAIAAAKAGVEGLARSAAASYGHRGIRVNAVAPGLVRSPLTERITRNETALQASRSMHVLGRVGEPEEVASAIDWLLDSGRSWVTGQVLGVDGGLATVRSRR